MHAWGAKRAQYKIIKLENNNLRTSEKKNSKELFTVLYMDIYFYVTHVILTYGYNILK